MCFCVPAAVLDCSLDTLAHTHTHTHAHARIPLLTLSAQCVLFCECDRKRHSQINGGISIVNRICAHTAQHTGLRLFYSFIAAALESNGKWMGMNIVAEWYKRKRVYPKKIHYIWRWMRTEARQTIPKIKNNINTHRAQWTSEWVCRRAFTRNA